MWRKFCWNKSLSKSWLDNHHCSCLQVLLVLCLISPLNGLIVVWAAMVLKFKENLSLWTTWNSTTELILYIFTVKIYFFQTSGPLLPMPLNAHSMVRLGKGQAILGGQSNVDYQAKIYSMTCSNRNCIISLLDRELSVPKGNFVAIAIPDETSGCITGGKMVLNKTQKFYRSKYLLHPQI